MFCPKCGAEVNDGAFCPKCGAKLAETRSDSHIKVKESESIVKANQSTQKNLRPVFLILIAIILLVVAIGVDFGSYLLKKSRLRREAREAQTVTTETNSNSSSTAGGSQASKADSDTDAPTVEEEERGIFEEALDPIDWDPFEGIEVKIEGASPGAKLTIGNQPTPPDGISVSYSFDKDSDVAIGDVVHITADYQMNSSAEQLYSITNTQMEYTVSDDIPYYPYKLDEIPTDVLDTMITTSHDYTRDYLESIDTIKYRSPGVISFPSKNNGGYEFDFDSINLDKIYVCTGKEDVGNVIYFQYSIDISLEKYGNEKFSYGAYYRDVIIEEGEMTAPGFSKIEYDNVVNIENVDEVQFYDTYISPWKRSYTLVEYTEEDIKQ